MPVGVDNTQVVTGTKPAAVGRTREGAAAAAAAAGAAVAAAGAAAGAAVDAGAVGTASVTAAAAVVAVGAAAAVAVAADAAAAAAAAANFGNAEVPFEQTVAPSGCKRWVVLVVRLVLSIDQEKQEPRGGQKLTAYWRQNWTQNLLGPYHGPKRVATLAAHSLATGHGNAGSATRSLLPCPMA